MAITANAADTGAEAVWEARVELAAAYRLAVKWGFHEGICNHLSMLVPGTRDRFLINPYGLHWSEITASKLLEVDSDGNVFAGEGEVEDTALYIHSRIHMEVPHATCVLHTHQPYATALTMVQDGRLLPVIQSAIRFYGRIAYDYIDGSEGYQGLALDADEGNRMAGHLGDKEVMFLGNHGVVVIGPTVAQAVDAIYYLERACQAQVIAMSTGKPLNVVSDNIAAHANAQIMKTVPEAAGRHFASLRRLLDKDEPDYAY